MGSNPTSRTVRYVRFLVLLLAGLTSAGMAACGDAPSTDADGGDRAQEPVTGGTAVVAGSHDLRNLNPLVADEGHTADLLKHGLFTTLVRFDTALAYQPYLAESWEEIGDTVVVFRLQQDVPWHDGAPTTAEDVAFTFHRVKDPETASALVDLFSAWESVEVVDSHTVRFRIRPHADPLYPWTELPIVPAHALDSVPAGRMRQAAFNDRPVGNGPFRFVSHRENDRWVFEANPNFPAELGRRPRLDRLIWRSVPESEAQVVELLTERAQLIMAPRMVHVDRIEESPAARLIRAPTNSYAFVGWNAARPPLDDTRVRQALTLGIDRQGLLDGLRGGYGALAIGPVPPSHWAHHPTLEPHPHDPEAARARLDEAGWRDRDGDGVREDSNGAPLEIELKIPANVDYSRDMAEVIRSHLADVGVRLRTRQVEAATLFDDIMAPEKRFDGVLLTLAADFRLDLRDTFHGRAVGEPFQLSSWSDTEADSLMDRLAVASSREEATPLWHRLQEILHDRQPWTFLYYEPALRAASTRLRAVEVGPRGTFVSLPSWWLEPPAQPTDRP